VVDSGEHYYKPSDNCLTRPIPVAARSKALGLRQLARWDCGLKSRWGHGCLCVVLPLAQGSPTNCGVSFTSALDGGEWLASRSGPLPPAIRRYTLYRRLVGPWTGLDRC